MDGEIYYAGVVWASAQNGKIGIFMVVESLLRTASTMDEMTRMPII